MALLPTGYDPKNLEDVLKGQATSATNNLTDQYAQNRKRAVSREAASGRLMSGVSDYPLGDLESNFQQGKSGIQDQLANSLAAVPQEDWLNQKNFKRSYDLAQLIGGMNKPSTLEEILGGIGSLGPMAAMTASFL